MYVFTFIRNRPDLQRCFAEMLLYTLVATIFGYFCYFRYEDTGKAFGFLHPRLQILQQNMCGGISKQPVPKPSAAAAAQNGTNQNDPRVAAVLNFNAFVDRWALDTKSLYNGLEPDPACSRQMFLVVGSAVFFYWISSFFLFLLDIYYDSKVEEDLIWEKKHPHLKKNNNHHNHQPNNNKNKTGVEEGEQQEEEHELFDHHQQDGAGEIKRPGTWSAWSIKKHAHYNVPHRPHWGDYRYAARLAILNGFVSVCFSLILAFVARKYRFESMMTPLHEGYLTLLMRLLIIYFSVDVLFYTLHRICHEIPFLWRHIHSVHHYFNTTYAVCAVAAHPAEQVFVNMTAAYGAVVVAGQHFTIFPFWAMLASINTTFGHSDFSFNASYEHSQHHHFPLVKGSGCEFGTETVCDRVLGTQGYRRLGKKGYLTRTSENSIPDSRERREFLESQAKWSNQDEEARIAKQKSVLGLWGQVIGFCAVACWLLL